MYTHIYDIHLGWLPQASSTALYRFPLVSLNGCLPRLLKVYWPRSITHRPLWHVAGQRNYIDLSRSMNPSINFGAPRSRIVPRSEKRDVRFEGWNQGLERNLSNILLRYDNTNYKNINFETTKLRKNPSFQGSNGFRSIEMDYEFLF